MRKKRKKRGFFLRKCQTTPTNKSMAISKCEALLKRNTLTKKGRKEKRRESSKIEAKKKKKQRPQRRFLLNWGNQRDSPANERCSREPSMEIREGKKKIIIKKRGKDTGAVEPHLRDSSTVKSYLRRVQRGTLKWIHWGQMGLPFEKDSLIIKRINKMRCQDTGAIGLLLEELAY